MLIYNICLDCEILPNVCHLLQLTYTIYVITCKIAVHLFCGIFKHKISTDKHIQAQYSDNFVLHVMLSKVQ